MIWKKLRSAVSILAALIIVFLICFAYFRFASHQIYQESANHLEEIYSQICITFRSTITKNWRLLHSWSHYISHISDTAPEEFAEFLDQARTDWHFTSFYFLSEHGDYLTDQGEVGCLNLGEGLKKLVEERKDIVVDSSLPSSEPITVFAVPVQPGSYRGFDYTAIAISFNSSDMTGALSIDAFSGQSDCFITYPDGHILFSSQDGENRPHNLLDDLRSSGSFSDLDVENIAQDWEDGIQRVIVCSLNGVSYYLSYRPVGFDQWMLVNIAPVNVVNASMNQFILVTVSAMALVFGLIAACIVLLAFRNSRQHMQEKNREIGAREKLFDLLTQNTDDIFVLFSPYDFKAEYVSPNLDRVLGMEPAEVIQNVRCLLFPDDDDGLISDQQPPLTEDELASIPLGGVWTRDRDVKHHKTRELRWFKELLHHCSLDGEDRFILMLSDRTKERQMYETLDDALHTARAANEAKSNFLSNMSHDIRTPMNAIVGFSILLERDADKPEKVREYTRKITASSQHLLSLINDILDMSKIESGKTSLNMTEFSLPQLLDELQSMILPQVRAKGHHFELRTKGNLPELLTGDKLRLSQVLINLLSNAIKYTQEGGELSLSVEALPRNTPNHTHLRFIVTDNGYGMSEGFVLAIFDPFAREVTDATRDIQGTGLGMAITKNIVDLMGGTISVQSELGQGSTFTVELELAVARQDRDDAFWSLHHITRLLVVDDDEDICLNICSLMEDVGVTTSYATDGSTAIHLASSSHAEGQGFHIILLDWKMPGMDGLETARRIRQEVGQDVPIFILTSYDLDVAEEAAKGSGIDMFLPKPFFLSNFQRAVAQVVEGSSTADEPLDSEVASLSGLRVLAAEDNEINAEILTELLEIEGIQCEIASNGQKAVERFLRSTPGEFDMIFMDIQMPVMDGYEATRAIRSSSHPSAATIPIIAMTANAFEEDIQTALAAGMDAHTSKPINMEKLKHLILQLRTAHDCTSVP